MSYTYWRAALAGEKPKAFVDEPQPGFYRKGVYERNEKGNKKRVGWEPVAIFYGANGNMISMVGSFLTDDKYKINELWSYVADNPISEEAYRAVSERGEGWLDAAPAADREVTKSDNAEPEQPLDVQHATAVDNAIAAAPKTVASEDDAAKALGSKNRIAELRLAADKAGKSVYEPIYRTYTAEQKKWSPIVKSAKDAEDRIAKMILTFREAERKRLAKEADEAAAKLDIAATPDPIAAPAPIVASYGTRKLKEELKKFVIIDDISVVFANFKTNTEVVALLTKLAQSEIDAGRNVPGSHYREGLI